MSTLTDRPETALVVIDVQRQVVAAAWERDAVVKNIATLVERARETGTAVVWVQHNDADLPRGGDGWQIVPELPVRDGEPVVHKNWGDAFEATELEDVLAARRVGHLVVAGAQTDACIRSTLHGAIARGYDATLVSDAHTTDDNGEWGAPPPEQVIAHTNLYWRFHRAPGRSGGTAGTAEVTFTRPAP
ncbi:MULTISPECIES: isochorismatase family protein [Catenuloplanes]|uniref:Nicotinamidase-related amidase n=1 Tax=Catenuloplanes niger TaxID=587534 RepID=A0AAE3ZIU4_9ACTN|nr:isochorismatase family protein [Catenuloplanes niger]MDR7319772.1 nicotinamidase-related amidase [Catenuloplanes niger]